MNCKQANTISIVEYLKALGILPKKIIGKCSFFLSPFRDEKTASFKVDPRVNLWVDYGDNNSGGTLIDLIIKLNPSYAVEDALIHLDSLGHGSFSFHQQKEVLIAEENTRIKVLSTKPIGTNKAITAYLTSREISPLTARMFCKEVYFSVGGKRFFGVGNENFKGWSIRNKYWKGCTAQGISFYGDMEDEHFSTLSVFEGIFDMMSFVQMNRCNGKASCLLVLNSLANIQEAIPYLNAFDSVDLYLDRDDAGRKLTQDLIKSIQNCRDKSSLYSDYKDLNDMLTLG